MGAYLKLHLSQRLFLSIKLPSYHFVRTGGGLPTEYRLVEQDFRARGTLCSAVSDVCALAICWRSPETFSLIHSRSSGIRVFQNTAVRLLVTCTPDKHSQAARHGGLQSRLGTRAKPSSAAPRKGLSCISPAPRYYRSGAYSALRDTDFLDLSTHEP